MVAAQRPVEQSVPPWQGCPAERRQTPVEPAGVNWVPAGHWHVLDAASQTEPAGCVQVHDVGPEDVEPAGHALHPGALPVGDQKLGLQAQSLKE